MNIFFLVLSTLFLASFAKAYNTPVDPQNLCSNESEKRLAKISQRGETRFSEFYFDERSTTVSDVEFTDMGETGGRRHRKKNQVPAKPEFGKMLVMKALGKEKTGWRNLVVKCGVNKGRLATFTYEILSIASADPVVNSSASQARENRENQNLGTPQAEIKREPANIRPASATNP